MRRIILTILAAVALALSLAIPANANVNSCGGSECIIYYGSNHGWNDWGGSISDDTPINFYQSLSAENSEFERVQVGTVCNGHAGCGGGIGPFTNGSGLNARYEYDAYYQFKTDNATTQCVSGSNYDASNGLGTLVLKGCASDAHQWFVLSSSYFLANVGANNDDYATNGTQYLPVLAGDDGNGISCNNGNGNNVTLTNNGVCQLQWNIVPSS
jgi:hypothetical protein